VSESWPFVILLVGFLTTVTAGLQPVMNRFRLPPLAAYIVLGFILALVDHWRPFLAGHPEEALSFLGNLGLVVLLFRIGLESNLKALVDQLKRASVVWFCGVVGSWLIGFGAAYHWLQLGLSTSLILATAFTATSVGVTVGVWSEAGVLETRKGQLLVDVAEMDDISAVVLMALLFSVIPLLKDGASAGVWVALGRTAGWFLVKLVVFGGLCALFSFYVEKPLTEYYRSLTAEPEPIILMAGVGFVIAALAGLIGFSLAIGAFFAGLIFSRDPESVKMEANFMPICELLSPFFFIEIGVNIDPKFLGPALGLGLVWFLVSVVSKVLSNGLPTLLFAGPKTAALIGVSMVPRAEIAMVIMERGLQLGKWAVSPRTYGAAVAAALLTCVATPLVVQQLLRLEKEEEE
jgi:Kef-type K+ transport system membrane component KefB